MPLEEKLCAVPYLKALTCGLEHLGGHGHDSTFTNHCTLLKTTHFAVARDTVINSYQSF